MCGTNPLGKSLRFCNQLLKKTNNGSDYRQLVVAQPSDNMTKHLHESFYFYLFFMLVNIIEQGIKVFKIS